MWHMHYSTLSLVFLAMWVAHATYSYLRERRCARIYLWWKTQVIGHNLKENVNSISNIFFHGSLIKTPTWSTPRHLSSTQSIGLISWQIFFVRFCPFAFTRITGMLTHSSLFNPVQSISTFSMPTSFFSSVNIASKRDNLYIVQ